MEKVQFRTIKCIDKHGKISGRIVVATIRRDEFFNVGFAFASIKDQFNKKLGQKIAYGRMITPRSSAIVKVSPGISLRTEIKDLLRYDTSLKRPQWVRDALLD